MSAIEAGRAARQAAEHYRATGSLAVVTPAQIRRRLHQAGITVDHLHIFDGRCQVEVYCRRFATLRHQLMQAGFTDINGQDCKSYRLSDEGESWNWMALAHFAVPGLKATTE